MKLIADFVSLVLTICVLCISFVYLAPIIDEAQKPKQATIYPSEVKEILYIDRTFTEQERIHITEAAQAWEDATKGIVHYEIIQLPDSNPVEFSNSLFIVKISPDEPEVLFMDSGENILGHYTSRQGIPTIGIWCSIQRA